MKPIGLIALLIFLLTQASFAQTPPTYNAALANKLGADDYGMKHYVMVFLKPGPTPVKDSIARTRILMAHLKNIQRLAAEGKLIVAGPFLDRQGINGVFVFNVATIKEVEELTATDPAVKAGLFIAEFHPWYCSAALMQVPDIHKTLEKKNIADR